MGDTRLGYLVRQELNGAQPRLHLSLVLASALPDLVGNRFRTAMLRLSGVSIGAGTVIGGGIRIVGAGRAQERIAIGSRAWINAGCYFDATDRIDIGDNVAIGQQVLVLTQTHQLDEPRRRAGALVTAPVRVQDGSWIGARALILPGVVVGAGSVVAAGAVVVDDVPCDTLVGGVPARPLRALDTAPSNEWP